VWYAGVDTAERDACHRAGKRREGADSAVRPEIIAETVHIFEVNSRLERATRVRASTSYA
jgi:hypothetical protein